jgi:aldose 1-epimerase
MVALLISTVIVLLFGFAIGIEANVSIEKEAWGTVDGKPVDLYTLTNANGLEAKITNYGGIVVSLKVLDRNGKLGDVVLGYDNLKGYIENNPYFGAIIGRYGNRIGGAKFSLDGVEYTLAANNGPNHLHGGIKGFDKVVWKATGVTSDNDVSLELAYLSPDGEEGYPGNLSVTVIYTLTDDNELKIDYFATTDKKTVVNLTHHSYFNFVGSGDILGHKLWLKASRFTPVDEGLIPTGELRSVIGTPMDFTRPFAIGARIEQDTQQLEYGFGYDHNWVLDKRPGEMALAGSLYEPATGRFMEIYTTEPGIQFYSGNFLDGTITGKRGIIYEFRNGLCLETQHFPDSPNKPDFPSTVLKPDEDYRTTTIYKFSVR